MKKTSKTNKSSCLTPTVTVCFKLLEIHYLFKKIKSPFWVLHVYIYDTMPSSASFRRNASQILSSLIPTDLTYYLSLSRKKERRKHTIYHQNKTKSPLPRISTNEIDTCYVTYSGS